MVGGLLAAALGAVIGGLGFRFGLRGFYFVLLTVAFAEVCRIVTLNTEAMGGALGLYITFTGNPWQLQFQDNRAYYYLALALMLLATGVVALRRAEPPRALPRAPSARTRTPPRPWASTPSATSCCAIVLSAFLTGLGGAFYANYLFSLQPNAGVRHPAVGGHHHSARRRRRGHARSGPSWDRSSSRRWRRSPASTSPGPAGPGLHLVRLRRAPRSGRCLFLPQGAYPQLRRAWARRRSEARDVALLEVVDLRKRFGGLQRGGRSELRDRRRARSWGSSGRTAPARRRCST